ncbi:hypothetical protein BN1708_017386, partial [Verticillium longisporum]
YEPAALEILKKKKGGKYLVLQIDENWVPADVETRTVYGIKLQQHRNDAKIGPNIFSTIITPKDSAPLSEDALRDLTVATLAVKYTQSNSVCYAARGQTIGLGAGQQSRIHCTRLAGDKSDNWWLRFHPRVLGIKWKKGTKRPDKSNAIDLLVSGELPKGGKEREAFEGVFEDVPAAFTEAEREEWLGKLTNVAVSSDAFFDDIESESDSGESNIDNHGEDEQELKSALKKSSNPVTAEAPAVQRPTLPPQTDPKDLDVKTLNPLTAEIIARQATINIGTIGHVAHGKSTVVKAISGVQTVRFKNELIRNITIKLGYANAKIYQCDNQECPRPGCFRSYKSEKEVDPPCEREGCEGTYRLLRHV